MSDPAAPTILVTGATGTVGHEVVRALLERGARVRAFMRSSSTAPLPPGCERTPGDLRDPDAVAAALAGVDGAFYVSPHEADEEQLADIFARACEQHGTRVVFVGVHADGKTRIGRALRRLLVRALAGSQYTPKFRLSERLRGARTDVIVLMPTNFYQNDELFRAELLAGEFVQPLSPKGINRVDVRDIGDAAARALLDRAIRPGAYPVVGPASLSSAEAAVAWTHALGREVRDAGADVERFEALLARQLVGKKRDDFTASFRALRRIHLPTDPRDVAATTELLGRPPRSYETYVRDAAARWARM